jgi:hypothetical protein
MPELIKYRPFGSDVIEFRVGKESSIFWVHEDICRKVEALSNMIDDAFVEAKAQLLEDDPVTFSWLLEWLYAQNTRVLSETKGVMQRIELYVLASKYRVASLKDRLMDSIHKSITEHRELLDVAEINYAYKNCNGACGLKRFITKFHVFCTVGGDSHISKEALYKLLHDHEELGLAVLERLERSNGRMMESPEETTVEESNCEYHDHGSDEPCDLRDQYPTMTLDQFLNGFN